MEKIHSFWEKFHNFSWKFHNFLGQLPYQLATSVQPWTSPLSIVTGFLQKKVFWTFLKLLKLAKNWIQKKFYMGYFFHKSSKMRRATENLSRFEMAYKRCEKNPYESNNFKLKIKNCVPSQNIFGKGTNEHRIVIIYSMAQIFQIIHSSFLCANYLNI